MKRLFFFVSIILLIFMQLSWPGFLYFFNCKPDLLLVFAISLSFFTDLKTTLIFSVLAGLAKDFFAFPPLAVNTISFGAFSYFAYKLSTQISSENEYVRLFIVLSAVFLNNLVLGILVVNSQNTVSPGIFLRTLVVPSVYSSLLSPFVFKFVQKISQKNSWKENTSLVR